jgi:hypothetical protein
MPNATWPIPDQKSSQDRCAGAQLLRPGSVTAGQALGPQSEFRNSSSFALASELSLLNSFRAAAP